MKTCSSRTRRSPSRSSRRGFGRSLLAPSGRRRTMPRKPRWEVPQSTALACGRPGSSGGSSWGAQVGAALQDLARDGGRVAAALALQPCGLATVQQAWAGSPRACTSRRSTPGRCRSCRAGRGRRPGTGPPAPCPHTHPAPGSGPGTPLRRRWPSGVPAYQEPIVPQVVGSNPTSGAASRPSQRQWTLWRHVGTGLVARGREVLNVTSSR
jgi:hypothetical protein